ncbi:unnamed protein product [Cylindrotheca closterium]|uniref:Uncharacterized protein n=1 Tax=Cylindrotheca closterium TaxID=2856 RepID=A0AAD2CGG5_9STRA|nr:unnamed protein product [Cylindrotheca closterium]CAJ1931968.1 unnamed protein product [Cylindrotheca closterium]
MRRSAKSARYNDTRRLLSKLEDDDWTGILQSYSQVEYETSLFVDKHVFVVSTPAMKCNSDCPSVAMDADFGTRSVNIRNFTLPRDLPRLSIGTFPLSEIAKAFHIAEAKVTSDSDNMENFDIVMQNCGDFPAHMLTVLNVNFDHDMVRFIAKRLQKTRRAFGRFVRTNPNAMSLLSDKNLLGELTDLQLLELLVESRVKHLYDSSTTPLSDSYMDPSQGCSTR